MRDCVVPLASTAKGCAKVAIQERQLFSIHPTEPGAPLSRVTSMRNVKFGLYILLLTTLELPVLRVCSMP
jgi:hypothetical protein